MATIAAFVIVFAVLILVMQQRPARPLRGPSTNLEHEARLMAGMLDSTYRRSKFAARMNRSSSANMGGQLEAGTGLVRTGDVDLPVVKLGNEVLNGQDRLLKAFRGWLAAIGLLMIHNNKVPPGHPAQGQGRQTDERRTPADSDPVAKALLAGRITNLAIRGGKYNFSTVKF